MPNLILFDDVSRDDLLPLTFTRPCSELRVGMLTIREKWERMFRIKPSTLTLPYLANKFKVSAAKDNLLVNGAIIPDPGLLAAFKNLPKGSVLIFDPAKTPRKASLPPSGLNQRRELIALRLDDNQLNVLLKKGQFPLEPSDPALDELKPRAYAKPYVKIRFLWDIIGENGPELVRDFELITRGRKSAPPHRSNLRVGKSKVFIEKGAKVFGASLNTEHGPIYIGKNAEVMEGSLIRGPVSIGEHSIIRMGARIYGPASLGLQSRAGGELSNVVFQGYSNKSHDGFLGHAVLGEWCNLGAGTNNSNLKNNYAPVSVWNYAQRKEVNSGSLFCGLFMGDHSKCAINTMFNTGTVAGVFTNIFGAGFPDRFIPCYTWGGIMAKKVYTPSVALRVAEKVMARRGVTISEDEKSILNSVFELTKSFRDGFAEKQND